MKMDVILDQLLRLLNQETEWYQSMLTVIHKEEQAVIRSELNSLYEAGKEKETILLELRLLEKKRTQLVTELAGLLGYPPSDLTLTKISQLVDEPFADRLMQASADLFRLLDTLQKANCRNKQLVAHSLELLRGSFNLLSELMASSTVYYRTGAIQSANPTGKLVHGEI